MERVRKEDRLRQLVLEPRWPISKSDDEELSKHFSQSALNSVAGLRDLLRVVGPVELAIEIGCFRGVSTEMIALHCTKMYAIDPWPDEPIRKEFLIRMAPYRNVNIIQGYSPEAAIRFDEASVDFIYIDGMHTREEVEKDIRAWLPKVRPGGYIAGHDYVDYKDSWMSKHIQVIPAVQATIGNPDQVFSDSSWLWQKR